MATEIPLAQLATPEVIAAAVAKIDAIQPDINATIAWGMHAEAKSAQVSADAAAAANSKAAAASSATVAANEAAAVPGKVATAITAAGIPSLVAAQIASQSGKVVTGSGAPNGSVTATVGTLYVDTAKTLGAAVWRKDSGTGNTGWLVVDGDTGWRNLASTLDTTVTLNGAKTNKLYVRRTGSMVTVSAEVYPLVATNGTALFTVPDGFRPGISGTPSGIVETSPLRPVVLTMGTGGPVLGYFLAADTKTTVLATYPTVQAWPTTLPGTPG